MRFMKAGLWLVAALLLTTGLAAAQSTTGTISGRVVDSQSLPVPGVTVNAESPNLQGVRSAVTSENGDYIITLLPSGVYTVSFELSGFQRVERTVTLAPTQVLPVEVVMGPAAISETVEVVGRSADVLTQTAQVAINISQDLVQSLPTNRDVNAALLLAPSVHPTGPNGAYSIAGSMSFENLFMINGVNVNENLRGQALDLYIEDAIQETTVATAGVSSEFGRFGGGVVNVITKSGGNLFSGSFRETLIDDDWRTLSPFEQTAMNNDAQHRDPRLNTTTNERPATVPTHEYTFGGPLAKDRLWFFTAGRLQTQKTARQLVQTLIPFETVAETRRYEAKGTYALSSNHRFQADYVKIINNQLDTTSFSFAAIMDKNSLEDRKLPQDLYAFSYSGVLSPSLFVESRVSLRNFTFIGAGSKSNDLIDGTLMIDVARGNLRYWAATFCGVCLEETRDNQDIFAKASYFLSTKGAGSHTMTFGFDAFNDMRQADNHQSGSDYRILGTTSIIQGTGDAAVIYPVLNGSDNSTRIQWNPIPVTSQGSNFRTYSTFYNDSWRVSGRVTANLGIRWDKNHGVDQTGSLVANDSAISPRFGVIWDPMGDQRWSVTGSFSKYVAAIANSIADGSSAAGNPQNQVFFYQGPSINVNPTGALTSTPDALRQLFAWFQANGGATRPFASAPTFPGVSPQIRDSLASPNVLEYAAGLSRQFGSRAAVRADFVYRDYKDFYIQRIDTSTGKVSNAVGTLFDLALIQNDKDGLLKRRYSGLSIQGTYRAGSRADFGATYTLSHAWGNFEGENTGSGPINFGGTQYPEYKQASWNYPEGDLSIDQRHRGRLWLNYGIPKVTGLTLSLLETLETGVPYGGSSGSGVNAQPYVTNPGYQTPPPASSTTYFFTARDAFRAEGQKRTDLAVNYAYDMSAGGARSINFFVQAQIINLFDQSQLCGCGGTVFANGGAVTQTTIDQTVRTAATNSALYTTFNPFTTTPVKGTNWDFGPIFGTALNRFAYTSPRQFRMSVGVRF
jgi:outer membrane receptor for ferrienterochelin and colicin